MFFLSKIQIHSRKSRSQKKFLIANSHYADGRYNEAIYWYQESIKIDDQNSDVYSNLASAYQDADNLELAVHYFKLAISLNKYHSSANFNLALIYQDTNRIPYAVDLYKNLLQNEPNSFDIWSNLGSCYHQLGNLAEAITAYENALNYRVNDEHTSTLYEHIGRALLRIPSKSSEAMIAFQQSLHYNPSNEISIHLLASLQSESNNLEIHENKVTKASSEYVTQLFDDYSETFESSLHSLQYQAPELLFNIIHSKFNNIDNNQFNDTDIKANIIETYMNDIDMDGNPTVSKESSRINPNNQKRFIRWGSVIDLGCGTGLFGSFISNQTENLIGVDLSSRMLAQAEKKVIYKHLFCGDIITFLRLLVDWRRGMENKNVPIRRKLSGSVTRSIK